MIRISLKEVVGSGYKEFWHYKGRYIALKGGRASKKSKTTALRWIVLMMKYPGANLLVVRKTGKTLKDSCFADLKWAIHQLKVTHLWRWKESPLEIHYEPTGQKILFRGLDDPLKITSITVEKGHLCWCWFEEAYEIMDEDQFDKVDMSIRGQLPEGLFKQIVLSFNPWNEKHWLKRRFFDSPGPNTLALTTNYLCNEFLGQDDIELFEWMKQHKPRRYRIEGLGEWGIAEGVIYEGWEELDFDYREIAKRPGVRAGFGLDFGYSTDPSGFIALLYDKDNRSIYVFDEHYQRGMLNNELAEMIKYKGYGKERIIADSSEPKSIDEMKRLYGISRIEAAQKGPDSVRNGIQFIQQHKLYVHPKCTNTIMELSNYVWKKDNDGKITGEPIDDFNHLLDAMRYATEPFRVKKSSQIFV